MYIRVAGGRLLYTAYKRCTVRQQDGTYLQIGKKTNKTKRYNKG